MQTKSDNNKIATPEKPDEWWYTVYAAVFITTIVVIAALATFTNYFS